jgi:sec-independent protein translocase protein TatC
MSDKNNKAEQATETEIPFMSHLVELRDRLLRAVLLVLIIFLGLFSFSNELYSLLAEPLLIHLPTGSSMIATEVASPFLTPFKLSMMSAIFIGMPFILYQLWAFIAPGLYKHEKSMAFPLLFSSIILFYLGMTFAYFVVFPLMFQFFTGIALEGVTMMTDITKYLDFVLKMFFAFGMAFEVPIATILVISTGMTTAQKLSEKRPYIIVVAFIMGMLLTPPDVVSQMLLAVPIWVLFELGLVFSRILTRKKVRLAKEREEQEEKDLDDEFEQAIAEEKQLGQSDSSDSDKP